MNDFSDPIIFNVYKPVGQSSFQVVSHFKRNLDFSYGKIGHFGTLDPFADGVLLIGISGAQRLNDYIHKYYSKVYRAKGKFGVKKDTGDLTGKIVLEKDIEDDFKKLTVLQIEEKIKNHFLGEYAQGPHAFSAAKHNGKKLYEYALKGEVVVKEKKQRYINSFKVESFNYPEIQFIVEVSSGTYVRTLFEEISEYFGGAGHLTSLTRIQIGPFTLESTLKESEFPKKGETLDYWQNGISLDKSLLLHKIVLDSLLTKKFIQGQNITIENVSIERCRGAATDEVFWVFNNGGLLLGLGHFEDGLLKTKFNLQKSVEFFTQHFKTL